MVRSCALGQEKAEQVQVWDLSPKVEKNVEDPSPRSLSLARPGTVICHLDYPSQKSGTVGL